MYHRTQVNNILDSNESKCKLAQLQIPSSIEIISNFVILIHSNLESDE